MPILAATGSIRSALRWKQELDGAAKYWVTAHYSASFPFPTIRQVPSSFDAEPVVAMGAVCAQASLPTKEVRGSHWMLRAVRFETILVAGSGGMVPRC